MESLELFADLRRYRSPSASAVALCMWEKWVACFVVVKGLRFDVLVCVGGAGGIMQGVAWGELASWPFVLRFSNLH